MSGFDFKRDPLENFSGCLNEAQSRGVPEANAMSLASISSDANRPANRIVLFKGLIEGGFSFYTNYHGRKGRDLEKNQNVSAAFFWPHLDQQIRIEGYVEKLSSLQSDAYFSSRPRESQLGAWTSDQSQRLASFDAFTRRYDEFEMKFRGQPVPRPPHWGGYRILPLEIEFWFGRAGRLHERFVYSRSQLQVSWERFLRFP
jgi:pyridoxamine 5'-phosphate oxidase